MRIGFNPHKDKKQEASEYFHQVVIPVYIPNQDDYFKDSFTILKYCMESLLLTSHKKTYFTIVNNGSCQEIVDYLNNLFEEHKIHEVIHCPSIGKLNAVLKGLSGNNFQLVTIADSDVLFLNHWQKETYAVFNAFPKAGAVCPTPSAKSFKTYTTNIWCELFFSKKLYFTDVKNPKALEEFANSIGYPGFYNKYQLDKYLTVSGKDFKAVVGAGHFITTYRGAIFEKLEKRYSGYKLGGDSEKELLDLPVVKKGLWRLSTLDNFAYHMGNSKEDWMQQKLDEIEPNEYVAESKLNLNTIPSTQLGYWIKNKLFAKFFLRKKILTQCLRYKGLSKEAAEHYL
ncbi:glycosyltransferase family 2 protein [Flavobacterium sp. WW92]|mgnify:CR=1 FL=1|uniref:glycosyltransferase family A protein n=1 Tax=unclassified Flavobacterium TaxID=196869 RepID=UPI0022250EAA|nr:MULTISPECIES: glycosyltransferase family A protein [unclassified Flavobacterium]WDO14487.1 glycosyltransferase family 2 protein [Flavobacterium sp. WW92]